MPPVLSQNQMDQIINFAEEKHEQQDFDHTMWHIELTARIARYLAAKEFADIEACAVASYLHDIAKNNSGKHAIAGADEAKVFLREIGAPKTFVDQVHYAISQHDNDLPKKTKEAKVLWDADKLQSIGPLGFARIFGYRLFYEEQDIRFAAEKARQYLNFYCERFYTNTGREIAQRMHNFMKEFYHLYDNTINVKFEELL